MVIETNNYDSTLFYRTVLQSTFSYMVIVTLHNDYMGIETNNYDSTLFYRTGLQSTHLKSKNNPTQGWHKYQISNRARVVYYMQSTAQHYEYHQDFNNSADLAKSLHC